MERNPSISSPLSRRLRHHKINDRPTVDACGSLSFPSTFLLIILITLHSTHVATFRVDIWWVVLVKATEKHISTLRVPEFPVVGNQKEDSGRN
jgi:hypothetical protein